MSSAAKTDTASTSTDAPTVVDVLTEDRPIPNQKYVCVSFLSPEKILKDKNLFYFEEYLKGFELAKSMAKFQQFLHFVCHKHDLDQTAMMADFDEFAKAEAGNLVATTIEDDYKNFLDRREDELQLEFNKKHNFQTNVRGVKFRGAWPSLEEARMRCEMLREQDPHHDIFVGPVGVWMPYDPEGYRIGNVEYMEPELNQLMQEKKKNDERAKRQFDERVRDSKEKAIAENKRLAAETGVKLTQDIVDGELVAVDNETEERIVAEAEGGEVTTEDIRRELFEGEGIRTRASDKEAAEAAAETETAASEVDIGAGAGAPAGAEA
jgi:hypothetical protein